jgi:hypothetical protein
MSAAQREPPTNLASLQARMRNVAQERGQQERRIQRAIASTVVGQMLPDGVVKGGTAMEIRVGEAGSRYTPDFDVSRSRNVTVDDYVEQLRDRLERGWSGFTGTVSVLEPRQVEDVPADYVMRPFEIRLAYLGRHWLTVEFELGHDEVGSTEDRDLRIADDILEIFATIGLEEPAPIPLMLVEHQIAQKLHACTWVNPKTNRNDRAHGPRRHPDPRAGRDDRLRRASRDRHSPLRRATRTRVATHYRRVRQLGHDLRRSRRRARRPSDGRRGGRLGKRPDRPRRIVIVSSAEANCRDVLHPESGCLSSQCVSAHISAR